MSYYFSKTLHNSTFEEATDKIKKALKNSGFGILAEIDFQKILKEKLGVDLKRYLVLEACSPPDAYKSLNAEDKIGLLLPCNLLVQEKEGTTEVSSVNPENIMKGIDNPELQAIAEDVTKRLIQVIESL